MKPLKPTPPPFIDEVDIFLLVLLLLLASLIMGCGDQALDDEPGFQPVPSDPYSEGTAGSG